MEGSAHSAEHYGRPAIHLFELSVYLSNPGIVPSLVNPDFLRHNEIVDSSWEIVRPVMIESGSSNIRYSNGLSLFASDERTIITQRAVVVEETSIVPLSKENIVCIQVAKKYLQSIRLDSPYELVSIDPKAFVEIQTSNDFGASSPLISLAARIPFEEVNPDVQARAQYSLSDRTIILYASELAPEDPSGLLKLLLSGEIIREVIGNNPKAQVEYIGDILNQWEQDMRDFQQLAYQYHSLYVQEQS
jgi:hypothetical protein